jgi:hypothetical protein
VAIHMKRCILTAPRRAQILQKFQRHCHAEDYD